MCQHVAVLQAPETVVLDAVLTWVKHRAAERTTALAPLLRKLHKALTACVMALNAEVASSKFAMHRSIDTSILWWQAPCTAHIVF